MTLEQEFEQYKDIHKYCVLKTRLFEVFREKLRDKTDITDDAVLEKIDFLICEIARMGKYDELYESAWENIKDKIY